MEDIDLGNSGIELTPLDGHDGAPTVGMGGFEPIDLTAYATGTYVQLEAEIMPRTDGVCLLYPGKVHAFNGEPESGKSMAAQWAVAGDLKDGRDCLVLDYESDPQSYVGRLREMGVDAAAIIEHLVYINPEGDPVGDHVARAALYDVVNSRDFTIAVFDGMTEALALSGLSTNNNDEVTLWHRLTARAPARQGAAVIVVDHVTKSAENRGRFGIGAQAKLSAITGAACLVEVTKPMGRGLTGEITLKIAKDRPGYLRGHAGTYNASSRLQEVARITVDGTTPGAIAMTINPPHDGSVGDFRPTTIMGYVLDALEVAGEPLSFNKLKSQVKGKEQYIKQAVDLLVADDKITVESGPRNSTMHALVTDSPKTETLSGALTVSTVSLLTDGGEGDGGDRLPASVGRQWGDSEESCAVCGFPLPASITADGHTTHPNCEQETT